MSERRRLTVQVPRTGTKRQANRKQKTEIFLEKSPNCDTRRGVSERAKTAKLRHESGQVLVNVPSNFRGSGAPSGEMATVSPRSLRSKRATRSNCNGRGFAADRSATSAFRHPPARTIFHVPSNFQRAGAPSGRTATVIPGSLSSKSTKLTDFERSPDRGQLVRGLGALMRVG